MSRGPEAGRDLPGPECAGSADLSPFRREAAAGAVGSLSLVHGSLCSLHLRRPPRLSGASCWGPVGA